MIIEENNDYSSDNEAQDEQESGIIREVRFVPDDKSILNQLFKAMNDCQALYPDNSMSADEDFDEEEQDKEEEGDDENDYDENENEGGEELEDALEAEPDQKNGFH